MAGRTEEQKIYQDGVTVILGGKEYNVKPLKLRAEREWRQKLSELLGSLPKYTKVTTDDEDGFLSAMSALMVNMPDHVIGLFFDYAKDLDRNVIEEEATGAEIAEGFKKVVALAFPLARALTEAMTALSQ